MSLSKDLITKIAHYDMTRLIEKRSDGSYSYRPAEDIVRSNKVIYALTGGFVDDLYGWTFSVTCRGVVADFVVDEETLDLKIKSSRNKE